MNKQNVHYIYLVQITAHNGTSRSEYISKSIYSQKKKFVSLHRTHDSGIESSSLQQRALYVKDSRAPCSSLHSASWLMHCLDQVTAELYLLLRNLFLSPNARPRRELRSLREKTEGVIFSVTKLFFSIIISLLFHFIELQKNKWASEF